MNFFSGTIISREFQGSQNQALMYNFDERNLTFGVPPIKCCNMDIYKRVNKQGVKTSVKSSRYNCQAPAEFVIAKFRHFDTFSSSLMFFGQGKLASTVQTFTGDNSTFFPINTACLELSFFSITGSRVVFNCLKSLICKERVAYFEGRIF